MKRAALATQGNFYNAQLSGVAYDAAYLAEGFTGVVASAGACAMAVLICAKPRAYALVAMPSSRSLC